MVNFVNFLTKLIMPNKQRRKDEKRTPYGKILAAAKI